MEVCVSESIEDSFESPLLTAVRNGGNAGQVQRRPPSPPRRKPMVKTANQPSVPGSFANSMVGIGQPVTSTPNVLIRRLETSDYDLAADIGEVPEWFAGLHGVPESAVLEAQPVPEDALCGGAGPGVRYCAPRPAEFSADWIMAALRPAALGEKPRIEITETPFFSGSVRLVDHAIRAKAGMTVILNLNDDFGNQCHPFRGIPKGQRANALFCTASSDDTPAPVYAGEVLVTWWTETPSGMSIALRLDDGPDGEVQHPFECYRADAQIGADFAMGLWLLEDGSRDAAPGRRGFHAKSATQQSQIMCNANPHFQEWAAGQAGRLQITLSPDDNPANVAAKFVRVYCGVESRKELGADKIAAAKWNELLHKFDTWRHLLGR